MHSDVATASPPPPPAARRRAARRDDATAWVFLAVTTVVAALLGVAAGALTEEASRRPVTAAASDTFERPDHDESLGLANTGQEWAPHLGTWGIRDGAAAVIRPERGASVAVLPVGRTDGRVQVEAATIARGFGLAFRCRNAFNCWKVEAVPDYATWNVVKIVDGEETVLGNLGRTPVEDGTTVSVDLDGEEMRFSVDGTEMRTIRDRDLVQEAQIGLSLREPGSAATARWGMLRFTPPTASLLGDDDAVVHDDFDAPSGSALTRTSDGTAWRQVNGHWTTRGGFALAARSEGTGALLALVDAGRAGYTFEARMLVASGTGGIVVRCRDAENCWMVKATGGRAAWGVVRIVDGVRTRVATLGAGSSGAAAHVAVRAEGTRLTFYVDGEERASVDDPALASETAVGLVEEPSSRTPDVAWDRVAFVPAAPEGSG